MSKKQKTERKHCVEEADFCRVRNGKEMEIPRGNRNKHDADSLLIWKKASETKSGRKVAHCQ